MSIDKSDADLNWIKSSTSDLCGNCVEVAHLPDGGTAIRNSRDPEGSILRYTKAEWEAFLGGVRLGEFDSFAEPSQA